MEHCFSSADKNLKKLVIMFICEEKDLSMRWNAGGYYLSIRIPYMNTWTQPHFWEFLENKIKLINFLIPYMNTTSHENKKR